MDPVVTSMTGRLLVATPPLVDPNFDRTVVFVLEHNQDGALGVVLNRPSEEDDLPGRLGDWLERADEPSCLFSGGPVELDGLIGLGLAPRPGDQRWSEIVPGVGTVDLAVEVDEWPVPLQAFRMFRGYAGWGAGQLEGELLANAWITADVRTSDLFHPQPETLWRAVLGRQAGSLSWLAHFPNDVTLN